MAIEHKQRPTIFGEILFDRFPDGHSVLGGAPFNVAWHLQGFGFSPLMISAVGNDAGGIEIQDRMQQWGMDCAGIQKSENYPTGEVEVEFSSGEPSYDIRENRAYDHIDVNQASDILNKSNGSLLYHGTLAIRSAQSRQTLQKILSIMACAVFVDINLRPPWWNREQIVTSLSGARWVKLNLEELMIVMDATNDDDERVAKTVAASFFEKYDLSLLIVTLGERGAFLITDEGLVEADPVVGVDVVDTVGAGDAFSSVMICGLLFEWPLVTTLQRGLAFAAAICQIQGATSIDRGLYGGFLDRWQA
ncbi:MAG: PfkB family carbohydrate kinase [Thiohalomonadales bacterium]